MVSTSKHQHRALEKVAASAAALLVLTTINLTPAFALESSSAVQQKTIFYVSKNGNNMDGRTWTTAWSDLDQINWKKVDSVGGNVELVLDGGSTKMIYCKPLLIGVVTSSSGGPRIEVTRSLEPGHNGQVVIDSCGAPHAVSVKASRQVTINGKTWRGILIRGFQHTGILIEDAPVTLKGVEIAGHMAFALPMDTQTSSAPSSSLPGAYVSIPQNGILLRGKYSAANLYANSLIVHDTLSNVEVGNGAATVVNSWLYNSLYLPDRELQRRSSGLLCSEANYHYATASISGCIIGPGLGRGLVARGKVYASNSLFINATDANFVSKEPDPDKPMPFDTGGYIEGTQITSFMTKRNPIGHGHDCIQARPLSPISRINFSNSIFHGGAVVMPAGTRGGYNVTQFRTTGNTTFLSEQQEDPRFIAEVESYTDDVSIDKLIRTDFSLRADSPVPYRGSQIKSVRQLLRSPVQ